MSDPYGRNMFGTFNPYYAKTVVVGRLVVVLDGAFEDRGLQLITPISRALRAAEIHELIITDEVTAPGGRINRIAYLGFIEILCGGVIVKGDPVRIGSTNVGTIGGFDETHMPNHLNIIVSGERVSGRTMNLVLETELTIGEM